MNYEFIDLGLIFINLLFCGLLLVRQNKISKNQLDLQKLVHTSIQNPKLGRNLLNNLKK
jgi:hypothetical protein